ncbi:MAG TPA: M48 family metallopeptidase [Frankiaceae bacterium]|nr:M48 family metallopeptidase [Frankiaceae bacterium]
MTVPRLPALVAFVALAVVLVALVALTTPWQPLGPNVPHVPADPARDFTPEQLARENAFHRAIRPPGFASLGIGLAVAALLGLTPLGARLIGAVGKGPWPVRAALGGLAVSLLPRLVTLPLDARREAVLRRYGLSTQSWGSWTVDQLKAALVGGVLLVLVVVGLVGLARVAPRTWWAWGALGAAALVAVASYVFPLVVEPLFNRFTPLPDTPLRQELLDLADRDGLPVKEILVADASRRTTAVNAYVSGYGNTRRIVLYDTLLAQGSPAEVKLVVAHELGHVKTNDVPIQTAQGALAAATVVCGLFLLLAGGLPARVGADGPADPRVLALVLFAIGAVTFLSSPVQTLVSRRVEARADVHSLDLTGDVEAFVESEQTLAVSNLSDLDPHPLVYTWFFTHPTSPERIALARAWSEQRAR